MLLIRRSFIPIIFLLFIFPTISYANNVWVNTNSGVYHCPNTRWYANTKRGKFLTEKKAITSGYRPAYGKYCNPNAAVSGKKEVKKSISPAGANIKVWVNSKSHVYHCKGTRYYGNTKRGLYMTQEDALLSGNRPAYNKRCY